MTLEPMEAYELGCIIEQYLEATQGVKGRTLARFTLGAYAKKFKEESQRCAMEKAAIDDIERIAMEAGE